MTVMPVAATRALVVLDGRRLARAHGAAPVALATVHAVVVAWVAWYVAESIRAAASLAASPTPLPPGVFRGAWLAGLVSAVLIGLVTGASALGRGWVGANPMRVLPLPPAAHLVAAWSSAVLVVAIVDLATLPVYVALYEMGAFAASDLATPTAAHIAAIVVAPLAGIAGRLAVRGTVMA